MHSQQFCKRELLSFTQVPALTELASGVPAIVRGIDLGGAARERLGTLGVKPGRPVSVLRRMGRHGRLQLRAGRTDVVLRAEDAARIEVGSG